MSDAQDALSVARALIEAVNRGDRDAFKALLSEDILQEEAAEDVVYNGPDEVTQNVWSYRNTFPDLHGEITDAFGSADHAALELALTGTYEPYTYGSKTKPVTWRACLIATVREGRVARFIFYIDTLTLLSQLERVSSGPDTFPPGFVYQRVSERLKSNGA